jgi:xanthine dehydrogenase accessory factor
MLSERLRERLAAGRPVALATVVAGPGIGAKLLVDDSGATTGELADAELTRVVARDAHAELLAGKTLLRHYGLRGEARQDEVSVFIESFAPPPRMLIFGAVDFTAALARVAKVLGYRVTVCDARPVFATRARFPEADDVICAWPQELLAERGPELGPRDAICVLTHDPKFDVPAVIAALRTRAGYLGCMGSRRTCEKRDVRLREEGVSDAELARIQAPIGLDLGARTPEETAISICAEIIALRSQRAVNSLRGTQGPIHG